MRLVHFAFLRWHGAFGSYCGRSVRDVTWNWNLVDCPDCHTLRAHDETLQVSQ